MPSELVLVTGGSGFLGSWCMLYALQKGYRVRTTVRNLNKADAVRTMMRNGGLGTEPVDNLEFVAADLTKDDGWTDACKDCTYVLHVASPFPASVPKDENDLIKPARDGTLRVLRAAKAAGTVKRVVITSSLAAIGYGHERSRTHPYTEKDWTDLDGPTKVPPYQKSKTLAEQAAWDYVRKEGDGLELSVVNPVGILGPVLSKEAGTSVDIVAQVLNGKVPLIPQLRGSWVDVRDVADLHLLAMIDSKANGERYLATSGAISIQGIAILLKERLGTRAKKVSTRLAPNLMIKAVALFDSSAAMVASEIGVYRDCTNDKAKQTFGWKPRSVEEATLSCAESCYKYGLVTA